ncbi:MAG: hypothetical protein N4J56_001082 [Chroococcidiopsis sp. SAG 2025]|uniref:TetR/AcrR family transcriptional regulator n=1 Tax=Chroococcidiopsis sp. SAG 2025 TaxID=171389 RepID=UPI0029370E54|nr:TetR/AcrR family transcriptional regulator [Chroococcidiopsis sp. SAG 2025]MDV2991428.1 hypothetical protein [Chroococcidiopsis sp. SAG 2025]
MSRPQGQTLTKKAAIEAAIACLQQEGESALGVNRIARELGIQPPSMYKHFDGNRGLRRAVALEGWQRLVTACVNSSAESKDPQTSLKGVGRAMRGFARQNPALYTVVTSTQIELSDPDFMPIVQTVISFYTVILEPLGFSQDEIVHAVRMLHAAFHGFIEAEKAGLFLLPQSQDESYEWMMNKLIQVLIRS